MLKTDEFYMVEDGNGALIIWTATKSKRSADMLARARTGRVAVVRIKMEKVRTVRGRK